MSPETFRTELKTVINKNVIASCWLFTSFFTFSENDVSPKRTVEVALLFYLKKAPQFLSEIRAHVLNI